MFDSATDNSIKETEAVIVRIIKDGKPVNRLLGIAELKHAHADGILEAVSDQFMRVKQENFKENLVSFCADGASVNHGETGGVKAKLRQQCPWMIGIWCLPHRLELAVMGMIKANESASEVMRLLDFLYKTYHYSCKSRRELHMMAEQLGFQSRNPSRATGTRWCPHLAKALTILLSDSGKYAVITQHAEHISVTSKNSNVQGRAKFVLKRLETFKFAAFCHFLLDLLTTISKLSLFLQSERTILPSAVAAIQTCLTAVETMDVRVQPGGHLEAFLKMTASLQQSDEVVSLQGVILKKTPEEIDTDLNTLPLTLSRDIKVSARKTAEGLSDRFKALLGGTHWDDITDGAAKAVACFKIFNPDTWPDNIPELSSHGEEQLQYLIEWFRSRLIRNRCDVNAVIHQWRLFKQLVSAEFQDKNYTSLYAVLLTKEPYKTDFKDLLHLIQVMLVIPVTSASCERIFSAQKRIKSDSRSSLGVETLEDLIRISGDGPSLQDFTPQPAVLRWIKCSTRPRRPLYKQWPAELEVETSYSDSTFSDSCCCSDDVTDTMLFRI
ncbi:zinc finger protein 862-like [Haliotis rufescens]|uniref:zinc finger protein 862-like n=1 Tax=Haliotis rufescens TaxID=6454 RepID=UPI001EB0AA57|nr:zinc finger protein 862-like [Haliotis rufescens]